MSKDTIPDTSFDDNNNNRHDSLIFFGDYYEWFVPGIKNWCLTISTIKSTNWTGGVYDTVSVDRYLYMALPVDSTPFANIRQVNDITANYEDNHIQLQGILHKDLEVAVYDAQGKLIYTGKPGLTGNGKAEVPLDKSPGLYLLKVQNSKGYIRTFKIIKPD